jgi:hypothetical protein
MKTIYKFSACMLGLISLTSQAFAEDDDAADKVVDTSFRTSKTTQRGIGAAELVFSAGGAAKLLSGKPGSTNIDKLVIGRYRNASMRVMTKGVASVGRTFDKAVDTLSKPTLKSGKTSAAKIIVAPVKLVKGVAMAGTAIAGAAIETFGIMGVIGTTAVGSLTLFDGLGRAACANSFLPRPLGNDSLDCDLPFANTSNIVPVKKQHHLALGADVTIKGREFVCMGDGSQFPRNPRDGVIYLPATTRYSFRIEDEEVYCGTRDQYVVQPSSQDTRVSQLNASKSTQGLQAQGSVSESKGSGASIQ